MIDILTIHYTFALFFVIYILVDRVYIRNFIKEKQREVFYKKVKWTMLLICMVLVISGAILLFRFDTSLHYIKSILALSLIIAFFYCPFYMKKECSSFKRFMYRYFIVLLTVVVVALGLYL